MNVQMRFIETKYIFVFLQSMQEVVEPKIPPSFCPYNNPSQLFCCSSFCKEPGLVCSEEACKCLQERHFQCSLIRVDKLLEGIQSHRKEKSNEVVLSINLIRKGLDQLLELISVYSQSLYNYEDNFGLKKSQRQVIQLMKNCQTQKITGELIAEVYSGIENADCDDLLIVGGDSLAIYQQKFQKLSRLLEAELNFEIGWLRYEVKRRKLVINDPLQPGIVERIQNDENIDELLIHDCRKLSKQNILRILETKSNLKSLLLENCKRFDDECENKVFERFPKIEYFSSGSIYTQPLQKFEERTQFQNWEHMLPNYDRMYNLKHLKKIEYTIKSILDLEHSLLPLIKGRRGITEICIFLEEQSRQAIFPHRNLSKLFEALAEKNTLKVVFLKNFELQTSEEKAFKKMIYSNRNSLQTLEVDGIFTPEISRIICETCPLLRQLSLGDEDCLSQGKPNYLHSSVWKMTKLKSLMLDEINWDLSLAKDGIFNLKDLQCMTLGANVNDQFLESVSELKKLKFLKLVFTLERDSGLGFAKLGNLTQLQTLYCQGNIKGNQIVNITKNMKKLKKLAIIQFDGSTLRKAISLVQFDQILDNVKDSLTHLRIYECVNLKFPKCLQVLKKLKWLRIKGTNVSQLPTQIARQFHNDFGVNVILDGDDLRVIEYSQNKQ